MLYLLTAINKMWQVPANQDSDSHNSPSNGVIHSHCKNTRLSSIDLAPWNFDLFPALEQHLLEYNFTCDEDTKHATIMWLMQHLKEVRPQIASLDSTFVWYIIGAYTEVQYTFLQL
jgi:hypothetical protein